MISYLSFCILFPEHSGDGKILYTYHDEKNVSTSRPNRSCEYKLWSCFSINLSPSFMLPTYGSLCLLMLHSTIKKTLFFNKLLRCEKLPGYSNILYKEIETSILLDHPVMFIYLFSIMWLFSILIWIMIFMTLLGKQLIKIDNTLTIEFQKLVLYKNNWQYKVAEQLCTI